MISSFEGKKPKLGENCFVHKSAQLIGKVELGENSSVWPNAVLRADINRITIGKNTSIQDNSTIHVSDELPVSVGDNVTIGHNAVLHGCTIKKGALIGMGAIILNGAVVGENSVVAAGSVVREKQVIPGNVLVAGVPAEVKKPLGSGRNLCRSCHSGNYVELAKRHMKSLRA